MKLEPSRMIVRLERKALERGHVTGRIVGRSRKLVAVAVVSDAIRANGYNVFRRADISKLTAPDPYADFVAEALRLRGDAWRRVTLDLTSWPRLVGSACRRFPLITVHTEAQDPDVCYIGRPVSMTAKALTLRTIGPDAVWDDARTLAWREITRVDLGGAYEDALAAVSRRKDR